MRALGNPESEQFNAFLPRSEKAVWIAGFYDAQIFARRWTIRDKDPALKALLRCLDRARGPEMSNRAMLDFKSALSSRGLLGGADSRRAAK
jgi:hypothetical protein